MRRLCSFISLLCAFTCQAETLTIKQAVEQASARYPAVRVSEAQVAAAAANIKLARTAYLPRVDATAGINRATRNNTFGLLLPTQIIAPISGPVLGTNTLGNAWGSTVGLLATWEPFDFGLRQAQVEAATATQATARATVVRTQFEVATLTADAYLTLLAAGQTVLAAQAAVTRSQQLITSIEALVKAELRPGAELSLARAEQAAAQAQLIRAETAVAEAKAALAALLGTQPAQLTATPGKLLTAPATTADAAQPHPLIAERQAAITEAQARLRILDRSYFPRLALQGTTYARGTGVAPNGQLLGGVNGLGPNVQNWGIGFTANFPLLELPSLRARREAESARINAEQARLEQTQVELTGRRNAANVAIEGARRIAETTPLQVAAANAALSQQRARFDAGLATALDVADAQRRLSQAEIDDALARLNIWRARLAFAAAQGDLTSFLNEATQ